MEYDLLNPPQVIENKSHKLKRLVQRPNSYFIDIRCKACKKVTHTFTHAQSIIKCKNCGELLATPTGGKIIIKDGNSFRKTIE
jgi:small subunit ribosomal protein S27e